MTNIRTGSIVVGADGSESARAAVLWAAEQADLEGRPLDVVTAARDLVPAVAGLDATPYGFTNQELLDGARRIADAAATAAQAHRPGLDVAAVPVFGGAREVLADVSAGAHVLVLGSHGRGSVASKVLGSVSAALTRHAACPVVVCRPGHGHVAYDGVLVGADGTPDSAPVLELAFAIASFRRRTLTVLHASPEMAASVVGGPAGGAHGEAAQELLLVAESVAGYGERYPDVDVSLRASRGAAAHVLGAIADGFEVVVVGRHPVDSPARHLAPLVSTDVLEHSHTTVVVVPQP